MHWNELAMHGNELADRVGFWETVALLLLAATSTVLTAALIHAVF